MANDSESQPSDADITNDVGALAPPAPLDEKAKDEPFGFLDVASKKSFSEGEVAQAITIKFLVESLKERKLELDNLRPVQKKLYEAERDLAIEKGKIKITKAQEIVSLCLTTIGGAGMGLAIKLFEINAPIAIASFILFAGLVGTGVYLKVSAK